MTTEVIIYKNRTYVISWKTLEERRQKLEEIRENAD